MHALERDNYIRRALSLNLALLVTTTFLCALVFADNEIEAYFGLRPDTIKLGLGLASILVFVFALVGFRVDWEGKSALHDEAVKKLSVLKSDYRESYSEYRGKDEDENKRLHTRFTEAMGSVVEIPERKFARLKARHAFKMLLSRRIDECPGAPVLVLSAQLRWRGLCRSFKRGNHG